MYAPTFTANRIKLAEYGMEDRLEELNRAMVRYSREAAGDRAFVAGDLTMTGRQLYPVGDLMFEDLVDVYKEQVRAILKEGVDLFVIETMMSLQECRAALLAVKETCDLPVMISLTYNEDGRTLYGTSPEIAMVVLEHMGADIVGVNCSTGPLAMIPLVKAMLPYADIPIMVKPNAGMPELENGETVYKMTPEEFADACEQLVDAGASVVGGCCGTRPDHIKALADCMRGKKVEPIQKKNRPVLTSERGFVEVTLDGGFKVVGERINPTGKKALQEELRSGSMQMVRQFARDQEIAGAAILDVNMGTNGIDEKGDIDGRSAAFHRYFLCGCHGGSPSYLSGTSPHQFYFLRSRKNERTFADRQKVRSHVCSASTFTGRTAKGSGRKERTYYSCIRGGACDRIAG